MEAKSECEDSILLLYSVISYTVLAGVTQLTWLTTSHNSNTLSNFAEYQAFVSEAVKHLHAAVSESGRATNTLRAMAAALFDNTYFCLTFSRPGQLKHMFHAAYLDAISLMVWRTKHNAI